MNNKNIAQTNGYKGKQMKFADLNIMKAKVEQGIMKIVFQDEENKPENVELFERIKNEYKEKGKYLVK